MLCAKCRYASTLNRMLVSCCPTNWSNLIDPLAQTMFLDVIGEFFSQHCLDFLGRLFVSELFRISWWYIACVCVCVSHAFVWRCCFEFAVSSLKQPSLQASECTCDAVTVTMAEVAIWVFAIFRNGFWIHSQNMFSLSSHTDQVLRRRLFALCAEQCQQAKAQGSMWCCCSSISSLEKLLHFQACELLSTAGIRHQKMHAIQAGWFLNSKSKILQKKEKFSSADAVFICFLNMLCAAWLKSKFTSIRGSMAVSRLQLGKPGNKCALCSRQKVCSLCNGLMLLLRQPQPHGQLRLEACLKNHSKRARNATEAPSCNPVVGWLDWDNAFIWGQFSTNTNCESVFENTQSTLGWTRP